MWMLFQIRQHVHVLEKKKTGQVHVYESSSVYFAHVSSTHAINGSRPQALSFEEGVCDNMPSYV